MEPVSDIILLESKIIADSDCIQPLDFKKLHFWKKTYDQTTQHIKSRDITWPTKVHLVKGMGFPVVMYGCESWTIKKPEHQRTDDFGIGEDS